MDQSHQKPFSDAQREKEQSLRKRAGKGHSDSFQMQQTVERRREKESTRESWRGRVDREEHLFASCHVKECMTGARTIT